MHTEASPVRHVAGFVFKTAGPGVLIVETRALALVATRVQCVSAGGQSLHSVRVLV